MPGGRPTKRTPELMEILTDALAHGMSDEDACAVADINRETFYAWMKIPAFVEGIKSAVSKRKLARIKKVEAGEPGWQAICWLLERQDPSRFARPEVMLQYRLQEAGLADVPSQKQVIDDLVALGYGKRQ